MTKSLKYTLKKKTIPLRAVHKTVFKIANCPSKCPRLIYPLDSWFLKEHAWTRLSTEKKMFLNREQLCSLNCVQKMISEVNDQQLIKIT